MELILVWASIILWSLCLIIACLIRQEVSWWVYAMAVFMMVLLWIDKLNTF